MERAKLTPQQLAELEREVADAIFTSMTSRDDYELVIHAPSSVKRGETELFVDDYGDTGYTVSYNRQRHTISLRGDVGTTTDHCEMIALSIYAFSLSRMVKTFVDYILL